MLKGKNAIVTGSTSGIGLGIAKALAEQGCNIMLNGFGDEAVIKQEIENIKKLSVKVDYSPADMSKPEQIEKMISGCVISFGSCDILINNAGIQFTSPIEEFPTEKWDAIMAINLSSSFHTMKAALPGMKEQGFGRIINIASVHGLVASKNKAAYVAAKHGVIGLTKVTALEAAQSGITCNAICPGWVKTPLVQKQIEAIAKEKGISIDEASDQLLDEKQPNMRFNTPETIGGMVVFLCGDNGAAMTGEVLTMSGGWVAQ